MTALPPEQELHLLRQQQEALLRAIAHDLPAPLRHIQSFAPLLVEAVQTLAAAAPHAADAAADALECAQFMQQGAQRMGQMLQALADARYDDQVGTIILTGFGEKAFCAGGDQKIRGDYGGYRDDEGTHHLNVLDFQRDIRTCPKPVVAMVAGYAVGGGHVLHMMCDLTIAADNAQFGQTGPKVGSFDGGWGASYMARIVGQKKAREIWFLCRMYDAKQALDMGLVNTVVPLAELERETVRWCREMLQNSPMALRCLKAGAHGYANKGGDPVQLIAAVKTVVEGRKYLTPEVAQLLADSLAQPTPELPHESLSERELQTLVKIASGKRLSDIAEELMLSPKTVSVYRARVLEKLKLTNNAELTVYAIRNRLV